MKRQSVKIIHVCQHCQFLDKSSSMNFTLPNIASTKKKIIFACEFEFVKQHPQRENLPLYLIISTKTMMKTFPQPSTTLLSHHNTQAPFPIPNKAPPRQIQWQTMQSMALNVISGINQKRKITTKSKFIHAKKPRGSEKRGGDQILQGGQKQCFCRQLHGSNTCRQTPCFITVLEDLVRRGTKKLPARKLCLEENAIAGGGIAIGGFGPSLLQKCTVIERIVD